MLFTPMRVYLAAIRAIESFRVAIDIQPHDSTFLQLGKVYGMMDDYSQVRVWGGGCGRGGAERVCVCVCVW